jgi:hypothetical protein
MVEHKAFLNESLSLAILYILQKLRVNKKEVNREGWKKENHVMEFF